MVLYAKAVRSRLDDILAPISDAERRWLVGRTRTVASELAQEPTIPSPDQVARRLMPDGGIPYGSGHVEVTTRAREVDSCHHFELFAACQVDTERVDDEIAAFTHELEARLIELANAQKAGAITTIRVAELAAWCHSRLLKILPLCQGNLAVGETFVMWIAAMFEAGPRFVSQAEEAGNSPPVQAENWSVRRDAYDQAVRAAIEEDSLADLTAWIDGRIKQWQIRTDT